MARSVTAKRIEDLRKANKLTQEQVAKALSTQRVTVAYYESGERTPKIKDIIELSRLFNVTSDYLLGLNPNRKPENQSIGPDLGLSDNSVDALSKYSKPFTEPNNLSEINDKIEKHKAFGHLQNWVNSTGNSSIENIQLVCKEMSKLPTVTNEEIEIIREYTDNEQNKNITKILNILLSRNKGIYVLLCIAEYFNVNDSDEIQLKESGHIASRVIPGKMIRSMYANEVISAMQRLLDEIKEGVTHGDDPKAR